MKWARQSKKPVLNVSVKSKVISVTYSSTSAHSYTLIIGLQLHIYVCILHKGIKTPLIDGH